MTLREKLSQDFTLQLPEFEDEDEPGSYFLKIEKAIEKKKRWKVKYQLTLGFLSFGKLAIWDDLDPKKSPKLLKHALLNEVFSGTSNSGTTLFPEDYEIDKHPQGDAPLIYDADSSQHSAIIDILSGKNMVINGPPGTGKSQTITNIIAAGLRNGKKILFVSEKLAALEVVRHRLNQANLGHFCLELHSHKTQKKKLLNELQERLDARFHSPQQLQNKISTLKRHKKELNRYAELMRSSIGNELGLTIHEVFWRTELLRQKLDNLAPVVQSFFLDEASDWGFDDIEYRRAKLESLGDLYETCGGFNSSCPWWGFTPNSLAPGDDEIIGNIVTEAHYKAETLSKLVTEYYDKLHLKEEPRLDTLIDYYQAFDEFATSPQILKSQFLPEIFCGEASTDEKKSLWLAAIIKSIEKAKELNNLASTVLASNIEVIKYDDCKHIFTSCRRKLAPDAFLLPLEKLEEELKSASMACGYFIGVLSETTCSYLPITSSTLAALNEKLAATQPLKIIDQPARSIRDGAALLINDANRLQQSFDRISTIAQNLSIEFDGSPAAVLQLTRPDGLDDVLPNIVIDDSVITKAQKAADYLFSELPLTVMRERQQKLHLIHEKIEQLLEELSNYCKQLSIPFNNTQKSIHELTTLGQIAARAPFDLLEFRCASLFVPNVAELIKLAEEAQNHEKLLRHDLEEEFYLDALPDTDELKVVLRTFRRGGGFFSFLDKDWRHAKRLFRSISKNKKKYKVSDYELKTTNIFKWIDHKTQFIGNSVYKQVFGELFRGIETDFCKIRRLHDWYINSREQMLKCPGFATQINLVDFDQTQLAQIAAFASRFQDISDSLNECQQNAKECLRDIFPQVERSLYQEGWIEFNQKILRIDESLRNIVLFLGSYVKPELSPKQAVIVLKAKQALYSAQGDLENLLQGVEAIQINLVAFFPGIVDISCESWRTYLDNIIKLANSSYLLADMLLKFGNENTTPNNIKLFFEAKLALDETSNSYATFPIKTVTQDWQSYVLAVREQIDLGFGPK